MEIEDLPLEPEDDEPSAEDLAAIEREWSVIEAEMRLVDAEIAAMADDELTDLDLLRVRRAIRQVLAERLELDLSTDDNDNPDDMRKNA